MLENTAAEKEVGKVQKTTGLSFVETVNTNGSACIYIRCTGISIPTYGGYDPLIRAWHILRQYSQIIKNADAVLIVNRISDEEIVCRFYLNYGRCPVIEGMKCIELYSMRFADIFALQASYFEECIEIFLEHPLGYKAYVAYADAHPYATFEEFNDVIDRFMIAIGIRPPRKQKKDKKQKKRKKTKKVEPETFTDVATSE